MYLDSRFEAYQKAIRAMSRKMASIESNRRSSISGSSKAGASYAIAWNAYHRRTASYYDSRGPDSSRSKPSSPDPPTSSRDPNGADIFDCLSFLQQCQNRQDLLLRGVAGIPQPTITRLGSTHVTVPFDAASTAVSSLVVRHSQDLPAGTTGVIVLDVESK